MEVESSKQTYTNLPGLNGIRAIAAFGVVTSHTILALGNFGLNPAIFGINKDGSVVTWLLAGFGVTMFFALSGFLITYLLLKEKDFTEINIKKFYIRRILRIWPLYYFYLIIILIFNYFIGLRDFSIVGFYIFFTANIPFVLGTGIDYISHYWSIAVEEQFYLFWPWIVRIKKTNKLLIITITLLLILLISIILLHFVFINPIFESLIHVTRFHVMLIGALGAIAYQYNSKLIKYLSSLPSQLIAWLVFFLIFINKFHIASVVDNEIIALATVVVIIGQITDSSPIKLNNSLFNFLGKISYGVYIYHPLLIYFSAQFLNLFIIPLYLKYFMAFILPQLITILVAWLSYTYLEKPFLRLKSSKYSVLKLK